MPRRWDLCFGPVWFRRTTSCAVVAFILGHSGGSLALALPRDVPPPLPGPTWAMSDEARLATDGGQLLVAASDQDRSDPPALAAAGVPPETDCTLAARGTFEATISADAVGEAVWLLDAIRSPAAWEADLAGLAPSETASGVALGPEFLRPAGASGASDRAAIRVGQVILAGCVGLALFVGSMAFYQEAG